MDFFMSHSWTIIAIAILIGAVIGHKWILSN